MINEAFDDVNSWEKFVQFTSDLQLFTSTKKDITLHCFTKRNFTGVITLQQLLERMEKIQGLPPQKNGIAALIISNILKVENPAQKESLQKIFNDHFEKIEKNYAQILEKDRKKDVSTEMDKIMFNKYVKYNNSLKKILAKYDTIKIKLSRFNDDKKKIIKKIDLKNKSDKDWDDIIDCHEQLFIQTEDSDFIEMKNAVKEFEANQKEFSKIDPNSIKTYTKIAADLKILEINFNISSLRAFDSYEIIKSPKFLKNFENKVKLIKKLIKELSETNSSNCKKIKKKISLLKNELRDPLDAVWKKFEALPPSTLKDKKYDAAIIQMRNMRYQIHDLITPEEAAWWDPEKN